MGAEGKEDRQQFLRSLWPLCSIIGQKRQFGKKSDTRAVAAGVFGFQEKLLL